jgi:hypothetical protein
MQESHKSIAPVEKDTTPQAEKTLIDRRTFLARGSAGALGIMGLSLWSPADASMHTAASRSAPPFSIGYWDCGGREAMRDDGANPHERPFHPDVTAAHLLPSGDRTAFGKQAEIIVHGLYGASRFPRPNSLCLQAHYTLPGENAPINIAFNAWRYTAGPIAHVNHATRFRMPLLPEAGLRLSLCDTAGGAVETGSHRSLRETCVHLTAEDKQGAMKLRPGVYFIPLHTPESGVQPAWNRYQFRALATKEPTPGRVLCCRTFKGVRPVEFDYLMLSIFPTS